MDRNSHTPERLQKLRAEQAVLMANLLNAGLSDPGCLAAYRGALYAGASAEIAFEAARQHMLIAYGPLVFERTRASDDPYLVEARRNDVRRKARNELIERIRSLPNPFADRGDGIQRANADLSSEHSSIGRAA